MSWKQPIPTGLEKIFGDDYRSNLLYRELIYRSTSKDGFVTWERKTTPIKRGQTIFGRNKYGAYLGWVSKTCERYLEKLEKVYKLVSINANKNYTVVTIYNYDELVDMSKQMSKTCPSGVQAVSTSKSVESVKNDGLNRKEETWRTFSPGILQSLKVTDPEVTELAHQAYISKAVSHSEKAIRTFIENQLKYTPPHDYINFETDFPKGEPTWNL